MYRQGEIGPPRRRRRGLIGIAAICLLSLLTSAAAARPSQAEAIVMAWRLVLAADPSTGRRSCAVVSLGADVSARLTVARVGGPAAWTVAVGHDNQPGSLRYLRVDRTIYTTDKPEFEGAEAVEIVTGLIRAAEFAFEWARRPDHRKQVGLFAAGDFAARAATCVRWVGGTGI